MIHPRKFSKMHKIEKATRSPKMKKTLDNRFDIESMVCPSVKFIISHGIFSVQGHVADSKKVALEKEIAEVKDYYKELVRG